MFSGDDGQDLKLALLCGTDTQYNRNPAEKSRSTAAAAILAQFAEVSMEQRLAIK